MPPPAARPQLAKLVQTTGTYPGDWIWEPNSATLDRVPPIFLLRSSAFPTNWVPFEMFGNGCFLARSRTLKQLIATVWSQKNSDLKIVFPADLPEDKFDFIVAGDPQWPDRLQSQLDQRFHIVERIANRDGTNVVVVESTASSAAATASHFSFGPVVERVVNLENPITNHETFAIDFDSGRLLTLQPGMDISPFQDGAEYLEAKGADAMGLFVPSRRGKAAGEPPALLDPLLDHTLEHPAESLEHPKNQRKFF